MSYFTGTFNDIPSPSLALNPLGRGSFDRVFAGSFLRRSWLALTGRLQPLYDLNQLTPASIKNRRYRGLASVPLRQIQGSEGRVGDFTRDFLPLNEYTVERWQRVATAMSRGKELPPIDLIQVGDIYYVRDGHHRVSVANARGMAEIDALVTVWEV
jgi:hypothetical protein